MRLKYSELFFFIFTIILFSCDKKADIPSYILIEKFESQEEGLNFNVQDVWVYLNNEFKGTYPLPARIPVFEEGKVSVQLKPGILLFEQKGIRIEHPFLKTNDTIIDFNQRTHNLVPKISYNSNAQFLVKEDFEVENNLLKLIYNSKDSFPDYRYANSQSFGQFSGRFLTNDERRSRITLKDSIFFKSSETWLIELDYLNKGSVEFGVDVFKNGVWEDYPILLNMPPVTSWQKTYFNPMPYLKDAMSEGYFRFYILVYISEVESEVFIDNLNIIKQID